MFIYIFSVYTVQIEILNVLISIKLLFAIFLNTNLPNKTNIISLNNLYVVYQLSYNIQFKVPIKKNYTEYNK